MKEYKRICSVCKKIRTYSSKSNYIHAEKTNTLCRSCSKKGKKHHFYGKSLSKKHKDNISESLKGKPKSKEHVEKVRNSLKGRTLLPAQIEKIREKRKHQIISDETRMKQSKIMLMKGEDHPAKRPEVRKLISEKLMGNKNKLNYKLNKETKKLMRLSALRIIKERKFGNQQVIPNYNPIACEIIRWFNMFWDFNFQHAENGGEVNIDGYFPDGCDKKRMTLIEIDERRHFNKNGKLREKDVERQKYLESLGYKVIRMRI